MIKIVSLPSSLETEDAVNRWLDKNDVNIVSLHYSTSQITDGYDDIRHSVLIEYNIKNKFEGEK